MPILDRNRCGQASGTAGHSAVQKVVKPPISVYQIVRMNDLSSVIRIIYLMPDGLGNNVLTGNGFPNTGMLFLSHVIFCRRGLRLSLSPVMPLGIFLAV